MAEEERDPVELTEEEYAAIDAVPPHVPGIGMTRDQVLQSVKRRTDAWIKAAKVDQAA